MSYSIYDKTGVDPRYRQEGDVYTVLNKTQHIVFDASNGPVFQNTLEIYEIVGSLEQPNRSTKLSLGKDYIITEDDIDYTTMSKLYKTLDDDRGNIIKSVTLTVDVVPLLISMDYNLVYSANPNSDPNSVGGNVELTPDLLLNMLRGIGSLDVLRQWLINPSAIPETLNVPKTYKFDIDKQNPSNLITDEVYNINTFSKQNFIKPKHGSFFKDSVIIKTDTKTLIRDVDYVLYVDNIALTKQTANTGGICDCILIKPEFVGKIYLTYHVVGGEVSVEDVTALYTWIEGIKQFLTGNNFVTETNISELPITKLLSGKITKLEDNMRSLLVGATYKDTTTGKVSVKTFPSGISGIHWFTVATLGSVDGSSQLASVDRFIGNIQIPSIGYQAEVNVSVSLNTTFPKSSIKIINSTGPNDKYNNTGKPLNTNYENAVLYRCLYDISFGAIFQVGVLNPVGTMATQDNSGVESCWKLVLSDENKTNGLSTELPTGWLDLSNVVVDKFNDPNTQITLPLDETKIFETTHEHERTLLVGNITYKSDDKIVVKKCPLPLPYSGNMLKEVVVVYDSVVNDKIIRTTTVIPLTINPNGQSFECKGSANIGCSGNYRLVINLSYYRTLSDGELSYTMLSLYNNISENINLLQLSIKV